MQTMKERSRLSGDGVYLEDRLALDFVDDAKSRSDIAAEGKVPDLPTWPDIDLYRQPGKHVRSGITKNHSRGQSKNRRNMAKRSRRKNRK